ncbi:MAG: hypothetical protein II851_01340 [Bacteroidales bacterium]|nr:hypothetical protein [Bacteroidales bacterium]
MKTYTYLIALMAGLAALSCNREMVQELPAPQDSQDLITIRVTIPDSEPLSRAGAHNGFSWYWSEGDRLTVVSEEDVQVFTIKEGFTSKYAEFVGKAVAGNSFTILYPNEKAGSLDWSKQVQKGNNSYDHLQYAASLNGVDDYTSFTFSPEWAEAHGGTLQQTGVLKMVLTLPDSVSTVSHVSIASESPLFYKGNGEAKVSKLELDLTDATLGNDHILTSWMTTSWNEAVVVADDALVVSVKTDKNNIEKEVAFTRESTLMSGKVNVFAPDGKGWVLPSHYASGKGTESKPWIIVTPEQMSYIKDDLAAGEIRYFQLGADIDMTGIDWDPLNAASPYDKQIDFDGAGHTISNFSCSAASYPSFFGVLYGKCHDVKFVNATINASSKGCGILGGYGGTTDKPCEVSRVHVQGTVTSTAGNNVGGLFGTARECTITACSADVVIDSKGQLCGGLIGADAGLGVTIRDCWTSGTLSSTSSICGGIAGDIVATGSSIYTSYSTMSVTTQFIYGGIVGRAVAGQKSNKNNCTNQNPQNHFEYCIAWNDKLSSDFVPDTAEHYGSATIVGQTAFKNYLVGCVRKVDMDFSVCAANAAAGGYDPFDQEDANPDSPMTPGTGNYAFGYHGKASAAGETLSQVAQRIGWSAEVWDFSAEMPKLK